MIRGYHDFDIDGFTALIRRDNLPAIAFTPPGFVWTIAIE
jgi:hypothetical protein